MKDRIAQIIEKENLTAAQFAEKIGISSSSLSHILSGRNNPSLDVVKKIHKACDYINLNWLLHGEGEMRTDVDSDHEANLSPSLFDENGEFMSNHPEISEYRKENELNGPLYAPKDLVYKEVKYIEKPVRKITEIRIFYDDGTYEVCKPGV